MPFERVTKGSFMPKKSTLGQKLWPTGLGHTQKKAKNGLKIAVSRSNLKILKNKKWILNGYPKDPSCHKSAS